MAKQHATRCSVSPVIREATAGQHSHSRGRLVRICRKRLSEGWSLAHRRQNGRRCRCRHRGRVSWSLRKSHTGLPEDPATPRLGLYWNSDGFSSTQSQPHGAQQPTGGTTQCPPAECTHRRGLYIHGRSFSLKSRRLCTCYDMAGPGGHRAQGATPDPKGHKLKIPLI